MRAQTTSNSKAQRQSAQRLHADFADPPLQYRPVPFWSWNERMEPTELRRQVRLLAASGWGGAFVHSRGGLVTPYLSEDWFAAVDAVMDECRQQNLHTWLYDEDGWPSGFSGGSVPRAAPEFRLQVLLARRIELQPPEGSVPLGAPVDGIQLYTWRATLDDPRFNGACYASLLHQGAMRRFIQDAYESYYRRYGENYGKLIPAVFTDEPSVIYRLRVPEGAVPFVDGLLEHFERMHGYDPQPRLHLLFASGTGAERFRLHYYRTVSDLFERHYMQALGDWCGQHGVNLTGHLMAEHHLYEQHSWSVSVMPMYRHFGMPGVDHLSRQTQERLTAKQCQSLVNQFGKQRMLSELYGMSGQGLTFEDRHWIAIQQIALGVNLLNPHLSLYTMAGSRKRDYPPNLYYQQPWWPLNRVIDEPLSRLCAAMTNGRYLAETVVIHPQDSVSALWQADTNPPDPAGLVPRSTRPTPMSVADRIETIDRQLKAVLDALLNAQRTFDLADESTLSQVARIEQQRGRPCLRVGEMRYPSVVLPGCVTLRLKTVELLRRFQKAGGLVVRSGEAPQCIDGRPSATLARWIADLPSVTCHQLASTLANTIEPLMRFEAGPGGDADRLFAHVRELEDGSRLVFLTNLDRCKDRAGRIHLAGSWTRVEHMDHWTGNVTPLPARMSHGQTTIDIHLAPGQALLLHLSHEPAETRTPVLPGNLIRKEYVLDPSSWLVERLDDNALTLDLAHWAEDDGPWSQEAIPAIAIQRRLEAIGYHGSVRLRYEFNVASLSAGRALRLVMEYPDRYQIRVNGTLVRYHGLEPWRDMRWLPIDIASLVRPGRNHIELDLGHWLPRPVGDDSLKEDFVELEAVYLVGDFAVTGQLIDEKPTCPAWSSFGLVPPRLHCFAGGSFQITDPIPLTAGDCTVQGLPFYAGRLRLVIPLPAGEYDTGGRYLLTAQSHDAAVAEIAMDGRVMGHFIAQPYQVDLTPGVRAGCRQVQITLYGTLRNLLGPHHHHEGELPAVTPHSFLPAFTARDDIGAIIQAWSAGRRQFNDWTNRYCMVGLGLVTGLKMDMHAARAAR